MNVLCNRIHITQEELGVPVAYHRGEIQDAVRGEAYRCNQCDNLNRPPFQKGINPIRHKSSKPPAILNAFRSLSMNKPFRISAFGFWISAFPFAQSNLGM